jgi:hypothetical protein
MKKGYKIVVSTDLQKRYLLEVLYHDSVFVPIYGKIRIHSLIPTNAWEVESTGRGWTKRAGGTLTNCYRPGTGFLGMAGASHNRTWRIVRRSNRRYFKPSVLVWGPSGWRLGASVVTYNVGNEIHSAHGFYCFATKDEALRWC